MNSIRWHIRWHILGTGSIGGLFAARLGHAGIPVTLLLRDAAALARWQAGDGLVVTLPDGQALRAKPPAAVAGNGPPPAWLLVTTKAPDTLAALAPCIAGDGNGQCVLLLQNGMGTSDLLRARWPRLRLWNAVTTAGAWRSAPLAVHCVALGDTLAGRWDAAGVHALDAALSPLSAAGICTPTDDIHAALWRKLAVNAVINALTALHGCRNGELPRIAAANALLAPLATEVETVAAADGVRFAEPVLASALRVITLTADNWSSMNRDVAAGRQTEIDFINGYIVARANAHGIAVPANRAMVTAIHAITPAGA